MGKIIISTLLDMTLRELCKQNDRKYDHFHPSSFGDCPRKTAYQYFGVPSEAEFNARMQRVFDAGHSMHERFQQRYFRNCKELILHGYWRCQKCEFIHGKDELRGIPEPKECTQCKGKRFRYVETHVKNTEYNFEGDVDVVLKSASTGEWLVVDLKTSKDSSYGRLSDNVVDFKYKIQITIYMWLLDIKQGIILYENKDNQEIKEIYVERDENIVNSIKKTAKDLLEILKQNKIPKRKYDKKTDYSCRYCDYARRCWNQNGKS